MKRLGNWLAYRHFAAEDFAPFLDELFAAPRARCLDYIGLDYYDPSAAPDFRLPVQWDHELKNRSFRSWMLASITSKWWDWRVLPRGLHFFCQHYAADFARPILIAENGMAIRHGDPASGVGEIEGRRSSAGSAPPVNRPPSTLDARPLQGATA